MSKPMPEQAPVIPIVEVLGASEQGHARPYLCRGADDQLYYVKGQQTNRASLWREWICGHLARALDLPIPPFSLVQVDEALLDELPRDLRNIGCLPAFGSRKRSNAGWLELGIAGQVPKALQRDILVFDWWVHNTDRIKGNPNLLWDAGQGAVIVIDHNNALDPAFDPAEFLDNHLFSAQWLEMTDDLVSRAQYERRLCDALPAADLAVRLAPEEWLWENSEFDIPAKFDREGALAVLSRCATPELWRTV
jgi:hypothetical protein